MAKRLKQIMAERHKESLRTDVPFGYDGWAQGFFISLFVIELPKITQEAINCQQEPMFKTILREVKRRRRPVEIVDHPGGFILYDGDVAYGYSDGELVSTVEWEGKDNDRTNANAKMWGSPGK